MRRLRGLSWAQRRRVAGEMAEGSHCAQSVVHVSLLFEQQFGKKGIHRAVVEARSPPLEAIRRCRWLAEPFES